MPRPKNVPLSRMHKLSESGIFIKRFSQYGQSTMKPYIHRDDYYIFALLTAGSAAVDIDFERKVLMPGDIMIISPWQIHGKPSGEMWQTEGWMLAFSPEMLSEPEALAIEEYSISPYSFNPGEKTVEDICTLCEMLERNKRNEDITEALATAVKSFVLSSIGTQDNEISGRYRSITLSLKRLLDTNLTVQKRPSAYASMLNITEIYLNEAVKGATGLSAGAYIRSRIIVEAKRQLTYTSLSAKEIAYSLGYDDYAYFSKLFRKTAGMSPSEYRKNLK